MEVRDKEAKIFIISGKARSGKDTLSSFLKSEFNKMNKKVIILQFSKYIKEYAMNVSDWDGRDETKPREMLQFIGTELIRNQIDENFFIDRMIGDIKVYSYFYDIIIISDARLVKEIEIIKSKFKYVTTINVVRPSFVSELTEEQKNHLTEVSLDGFNDYDIVIVNDGDIKDLENKVSKLVENDIL